MTPNSYEELEAWARRFGGVYEEYLSFGDRSIQEGLEELANALADLRKQRDEAERWRNRMEADEAAQREIAETLRAENERLKRKRDEACAAAKTTPELLIPEIKSLQEFGDKYEQRMIAAEAEAERLRKVAEGEPTQAMIAIGVEKYLTPNSKDTSVQGTVRRIYMAMQEVAKDTLTNLSSKED